MKCPRRKFNRAAEPTRQRQCRHPVYGILNRRCIIRTGGRHSELGWHSRKRHTAALISGIGEIRDNVALGRVRIDQLAAGTEMNPMTLRGKD